MRLHKEIHGDYERLAGFLRALSLRVRLLSALEFFLQLTAGLILVILGSYFALELQGRYPTLPFYTSCSPRFRRIFNFHGYETDPFPAAYGQSRPRAGGKISPTA